MERFVFMVNPTTDDFEGAEALIEGDFATGIKTFSQDTSDSELWVIPGGKLSVISSPYFSVDESVLPHLALSACCNGDPGVVLFF